MLPQLGQSVEWRMYLVELRPGKEKLFQSANDLVAAIRRDEVDSRARIYHRATATWISITLHPVYQRHTAQ